MYEIISDYLDQQTYRQSFNQLAKQTFGLDFESWYQAGHLGKSYIPYSIVRDGKIVSNVSANLFHLVIDGEERKAVQIGTVMTEGAYRKQGLTKTLMQHVLAQYDPEEYIVYLFANDQVLEFYPKLGFERVLETSYVLEAKQIKRKAATIKKLKCERDTDRKKINDIATRRVTVSHKLGVVKDAWPLCVYCGDEDTGELYYIEEQGVIVKATRGDGTLDLYDVLSLEPFLLDDILEQMVSEQDLVVRLHFVPDTSQYRIDKKQLKRNDDALFIRQGQVWGEEILFPMTSHT